MVVKNNNPAQLCYDFLEVTFLALKQNIWNVKSSKSRNAEDAMVKFEHQVIPRKD